MRMLVVVALLLTAADHWTTYVCLRSPIAGWDVTEANPIASWLFATAGLMPGLILDGLLTIGALAFLSLTTRFTARAKCALLLFISMTTGFAVVNNLDAIATLGVPLLGWERA